jgi:protein involved in polysaccharide export with SLBB domain
MRNGIFISIICLIISQSLFSQQNVLFSSQNLSQFKVETLTDAQINSIKLEMKKRNLTVEDLGRVAMMKGMTEEQFTLLSEKLNQKTTPINAFEKLKPTEPINTSDKLTPKKIAEPDKNTKSEEDINPETTEEPIPEEPKSLIFGSELFSSKQLNFEPNQSLATPPTYIVGAGDQLQIVIYGMQQYAEEVIVNKEGFIMLTNIGNVKAGGIQFAALLELLRKKCSYVYSSLKTGASDISVSISAFKTIQVTLIGVKNPGNYSVSSLATVFNALHAGGGPDENGSYRTIELIRNGKVIKVIDLYAFLCKGDISSNLNLQNDDIIRVPPYTKRVQVMGEIKKPGIFELKNQETYKDLLEYCSGYTDDAYTNKVLVTRISNKERKLISLEKNSMDTFGLISGDQIQVDSVLSTFENRISISGAVFRAGFYELTPSMKITDLIDKADGLTEDAHLTRALLIRQRSDLKKEIMGVNLKEIQLNPASKSNFVLKKEDQLIVPSVFEFEEESVVEITGEILKKGKYPYVRNLSLFDLIIQAGGLKESANGIVEISRIIKSDSLAKSNESEIIALNLKDGVESEAKNILLKPYDIISIRKSPIYNTINSVFIEGEVLYPGKYGIGKKNERIGEILSRAGGFNDMANVNGVKIIREIEYVDDLDSMKVKTKKITIPINYESIRRNSKSKSNISVRGGDKIVVERLIQTVSVTGEVELTSEIPLIRGKSARYYINAAGGFKEDALKKRVYVVYANGIAKKTNSFLFFRFYPKPDFGAQVVVTKKADNTKKLSNTEVIGISSILTSITGMTVALIKLFQN